MKLSSSFRESSIEGNNISMRVRACVAGDRITQIGREAQLDWLVWEDGISWSAVKLATITFTAPITSITWLSNV